MASYCLVPGAWHGAWCWERLIPELERLGHDAIAVDLPCDDPAATFETYAEVVEASLADRPDDVVLVGHSLAGLTIPLVASHRPIRHLVYLDALIAAPGRTFVELLQAEPEMIRPRYKNGVSEDEHGRTQWVDFGVAREVLYADCTEELARAAFDRLRPQARTVPYTQRNALRELPDVPTTYVICESGQMVNPEWARQAVPARLGVQPVSLPGSHSPFLSRPHELARLLAESL